MPAAPTQIVGEIEKTIGFCASYTLRTQGEWLMKLGGWWRLWIVLTALWILLASLVVYMKWGNDLSTEDLRTRKVQYACWEIAAFSDDELKNIASLEKGNVFNDFLALPQKDDPDVKRKTDEIEAIFAQPQHDLQGVAQRCFDARRADYGPDAQTNRYIFAFAFLFYVLLPPALIVLFSLLGRWIFRGFKGSA